jgi:ElaB/YqjD/DUF883 family membrane-anchored ribosome-binding protein
MTDVTAATSIPATADRQTDSGATGETRAFGAGQPRPAVQAKTQAGAVAAQAADQAANALADGVDLAQQKAEALQKWASDQRDTNRERIRTHPITSCAAAFGVGIILGMLLAR